MIKVESDMLVLDSSFTKEDVEAINYFVALAEKRTEERIIKLLEERHRPFQNPCNNATCGIKVHTDCVTCLDDYPCLFVEEIALIKGENK